MKVDGKNGKLEFACKVCMQKIASDRGDDNFDCAFRAIDNEYCPELFEALNDVGKSSGSKLYSVVYECTFTESAFCEGNIYAKDEMEFFSVILTADSFTCAGDRALGYAIDNFPSCDVSIRSIISLGVCNETKSD